MIKEYIPVLMFLFVSLGLGIILIILGNIITKKHANVGKCSAYECGFDAFESARLPFNVRYYLVAILFIIFDLETAFLFPWATIFREHIGMYGIVSMAIFLGLLLVGFIYEWKTGALEWE